MNAFFSVVAGLAVFGAVVAVVIWRRRVASNPDKPGRRDERAQAGERLRDEVKRDRECLGIATDAREAVKRDPKRAARTVRAMIKKTKGGMM